jgi:hypothetical protein
MIEASLYPVIPYLHVETHNGEVMSMSDIVQTGSRSKVPVESKRIESSLIFGFCYLICLIQAVEKRLSPWRKQASLRSSGPRASIFAEARSGASTIVTSSFMGL